MKAESLFMSVLLSYKRLLFLTGSFDPIPSLRDYCKSRHVVYRSFLRWAYTQEAASGILEKERTKRRLRKTSIVNPDFDT